MLFGRKRREPEGVGNLRSRGWWRPENLKGIADEIENFPAVAV